MNTTETAQSNQHETDATAYDIEPEDPSGPESSRWLLYLDGHDGLFAVAYDRHNNPTEIRAGSHTGRTEGRLPAPNTPFHVMVGDRVLPPVAARELAAALLLAADHAEADHMSTRV